MKKKNGFTLVELLAVIAILAILMLMVTPNVLKLFNSGRDDAFKTVVQTVWKAAEQDYISRGIKGQNPGPYCYETTTESSNWVNLSLSGKNKNLKYYVTMDDEGDITAIKVATDAFYYDSSAAGFEFAYDAIKGEKGTAELNCSTGVMTPPTK